MTTNQGEINFKPINHGCIEVERDEVRVAYLYRDEHDTRKWHLVDEKQGLVASAQRGNLKREAINRYCQCADCTPKGEGR